MVSAEKAKALLARHGKVRAQPPTDWKGLFSLPPTVEVFYQDVGPANITINANGNAYFLPRLTDLWKFQRGYRYNALTGKPIEDWISDWLVIADQGGDPFILDLASGNVLYACHDDEEWRTVTLFSDLNTMAACLAQIGVILREGDSAIREFGLAHLQELVGGESDAATVLNALGLV